MNLWFRKVGFHFGLILLLFSCHPEKNKLVGYEEIDFKTTDASEIYFKNIRQSEYQLTELQEEGFNVFQMPELKIDSIIQPKILHNWRMDKAYFSLFEVSEIDFNYIIKSDTSSLNELDFRSQTQLAREIYNAIIAQDSITYRIDQSEYLPFFKSQKSKETYRKMYFDYLRLIEVR